MPATIDRPAHPRHAPLVCTLLGVCLSLTPLAAHAALSKYRAETMRVRGQSMKALAALWRQDPVRATEIGVHRFDGQLASYSARSRAAQVAELDGFIGVIKRVDASVLTPDDRADRALILSNLSARRLELTDVRRWERDPALYAEECVNGIHYLRLRQGAPAAERYAAAVQRLGAIPRVIAEMRANVASPQPCLADAAADVFARGADYLELTLPNLAAEAGRSSSSHDAALAAATRAMRSASTELRARAASTGTPATLGRATYERKLRTQYFATCTSDSLVRLGERLLATAASGSGARRIVEASALPFGRSKKSARVAVTSPARIGDVAVQDMPAFLHPLRADDGFVGPAPFEQPYPGEHNVARERLRTVTRSVVYATPDYSAEERDSATARHLQLTIAGQVIDPVRKAQSCAAFTEGWLAATDKADLREISRRAVVDVRINRGDWSAERAVAFLRESEGVDARTAWAEVRQCYHEPGVAAAALLYREQIVQLREDCRDRSEETFNDALLGCGSIPPAIARDLVVRSR